jgi:hypothetical protein
VELGARLTHAYTPPCETLAAASSRPNSESLATRVVLAHPSAAFHPCTCGFRRGVAMVAAMLIDYDDIKVVAMIITREEAIVINYFLYTDT